MENNSFHSRSGQKVLEELSSHWEGLSRKEAQERLQKFGPNEIPEKKASHPVFIFLKQFQSWLIYILIGAAVFSFFTGHMFDVYIILAILLFNAGMGFIQEYKAEKAVRALKEMIVSFAKVVRQGQLFKIAAKDLVPGDIIFLEEGDRVPADARLLETKNLRTMEAALTGESVPIDKDIKELPETTILADRKNMVWMGTFAATGQAKALIVTTGLKTALGQIAESLEKIETLPTHFKIKTDLLAKQMAGIAVFSAVIIFLVGFLVGHLDLEETLRFAVAALVSAIPEGLPAVMVIVLAIGAHRMAARKAIVRNLQATETLGVANVIATDKTGTLTLNTMDAEKIFLLDQQEIIVSGDGWVPKGEFIQNEKVFVPLENFQLKKLLHVAAITSNARLMIAEASSHLPLSSDLSRSAKENEKYKIIGDPTEGALVVLAEKAGLKKEILLEKEKKIDTLLFSSEFKYGASLIELPAEAKGEKRPKASSISVLTEETKFKKEIYITGAPETILEFSDFGIFSDEKIKKLMVKEKKDLLKKVENLAKDGLRVIGLAYKPVAVETEKLDPELVKNITFLGLVGMKDPPRPEVKEAVARAKMAGIRIIMKTGDHKETALAIAKKIGLIEEDKKTKIADKYPPVLAGNELEELSEKEFDSVINHVSVFARLTPQMKLKILESLQRQGYIVAMTGDGVNDALALKRADVGIAMGRIGTDVAKESSSMVLADDNFASIVNAIEEGRTVFTNIKQSSVFLITTSLAEIVTLIISLFVGIIFVYLKVWDQVSLIVLPGAVLFINLVTDGFVVTALATEPRHEDVLNEPPRKKEENILSKDIFPFLTLMIVIMTILTISVFIYLLGGSENNLPLARAGAFAVMAVTQLFNVLNMRSLTQSIFKIGFFSNKLVVGGLMAAALLILIALFVPGVTEKFQFATLSFSELLVIVLLSSSVLWAGELYKYWQRKRGKKTRVGAAKT